jgi:hypothetical protein
MHATRRWATPTATLLLLAMLGACATDSSREQHVLDAIEGSWRNDRAKADRSGWRQLLSVTDGLNGPEPYELVLRKDGSFQATYGAKDFRMLMRLLRDTEIENPLEGTYSVGIDWSGAAWIDLDPGAPERRVTLDKGTLTLHTTGEIWRSETYARDDSETPAPN